MYFTRLGSHWPTTPMCNLSWPTTPMDQSNKLTDPDPDDAYLKNEHPLKTKIKDKKETLTAFFCVKFKTLATFFSSRQIQFFFSSSVFSVGFSFTEEKRFM